jgi:hypothetical protein
MTSHRARRLAVLKKLENRSIKGEITRVIEGPQE